MVTEQITHTLDMLQRIVEANIDPEDPFFGGKSSMKMDTTVISDVDLLPAEMDIEESSFLKNNSFLAPKLDTSADP